MVLPSVASEALMKSIRAALIAKMRFICRLTIDDHQSPVSGKVRLRRTGHARRAATTPDEAPALSTKRRRASADVRSDSRPLRAPALGGERL
jgi:hypothetical protein